MIIDSHMHLGDFPLFDVSTGELVVRHPSTGIILGPVGHGNIISIGAAIDVVARDPSVLLETSGMPMHSKIAEAVGGVGPDRVLNGSDTPFHHPSVELARVRVSGPSADLTDRVLDDGGREPSFGRRTPEAVA